MTCARRCVRVVGVVGGGVAWGRAAHGVALMPPAAVHERACDVILVWSRCGGTCGVVVVRVLFPSVAP